MKKYIGKIIGILGILLLLFSFPIGKELTLLIKGKPQGPLLSPTGALDYCQVWMATVAGIGVALTLAGIITEIATGFKKDKKESQNN